MDNLKANLDILKLKNPKLAKKISEHNKLASEFALDETKSGEPNLLINNIPVHDTTDPEQEAIDFMRAIAVKNSNSINFIYGLGLGFLLKRFVKGITGHIIVFEPDLDVLRLVFELVDFTNELKLYNVHIVQNFEETEELYKDIFCLNYAISTSILDYYKTHRYKESSEFIKNLGFIHGFFQSNHETYFKKTKPWAKSLIDNLEYIPEYEEVKVLKDKFKNKPALIISAGPSLNKNILIAKQYRENFVVFCVSTAIKTAVKNGITPDFICFVEHVEHSMMSIKDVDVSDMNIILQPITYKGMFELKAKNKFLFYADNDPVSGVLAKKLGIERKDYINRGTVSINALVAAKIAGCNPIVLIGQDLAYTDSKCYAEGSLYDNFKVENNKVSSDNLQATLEKTNFTEKQANKRLNNLTEKLYKVKGQNGETLLSPGDYASFVKYFEEIALLYGKDTKLINSTEGGAQINGYENMPLAKVIEQYAKEPVNKEFQVTTNKKEQRKKIIRDEIKISIELYDKYFKPILEEGYNIFAGIDFDTKNPDNFKIFIKEFETLLRIYKKFKTMPSSALLTLLWERNIFFTDFFIKHIDEDDKQKQKLFFYLHLLFYRDYHNFIAPQTEVLRNIFKNKFTS
ncbi:MAG: DUF115 domain-containing protein [Candidatus Gastranaerophilales bacterium]|nr:DUF115 domain-containing protein [Candidatus Gastranaerophilales bacterium]